MTDSELDEMGMKIVIMFNYLMDEVEVDPSIVVDTTNDEKIRIVMDSMTTADLSFLNYIPAKSERGVDNG